MQNVRRVSVRRVSVSGTATQARQRAAEDLRYPVIFELLEPRLLRSATISDAGSALEVATTASLAAETVGGGPTVEHFPPLDLGDVESAMGVAVQDDGKVIVFGFVGYLRPQEVAQIADRIIMARYNPDGTLDASYGTQGGYSIIQTPAMSATTGCDVLIADDGSAWIGTGEGLGWVMKVAADGRSHQVIDGIGASQIALQADGKLVFAGFGKTLGRLNADGSIDTTFGINGIVEMFPGESLNEYDITLDAQGRILVCGGTPHYIPEEQHSFTTAVVARFNPDGTADTSFADGGTFRMPIDPRQNDYFTALAVRSDGKIVLGGQLSKTLPHPLAGTPGYPDEHNVHGSLLVRLNADGTLDNGFGEAGLAWRVNDRITHVNDLRIAADGRIVGAIYTSTFPGIVVYEAHGRGDATLLGGGDAERHWPVYTTNLALAPDGSIFAVGHLSIQDRGGEIPAATAAAHLLLSRFTLGPAGLPSDPDDGTTEPSANGGGGGGGGAEEPAPNPGEPAPAPEEPAVPGVIGAGTANDVLFAWPEGNLFHDFQRIGTDEGVLGELGEGNEDDALPEIL